MLLEQIKEPQDIKSLDTEELKQLAEEIRCFMILKNQLNVFEKMNSWRISNNLFWSSQI